LLPETISLTNIPPVIFTPDSFVFNVVVLLIDIEGAQNDIFDHDEISLKLCEILIVEFDYTENKKLNEIISKIESLNFKVIESYGKVFCFKKDKK